MRKPVYLDYAASTPVDPAVATLMSQCLTLEGVFANPASRSHMYGWQAEEAVELARDQVASLLKADPREVIWTSGATESNNLAIKGVMESLQGSGKTHIVSSQAEHKSVLDTLAYLQDKGFDVSYLKPAQNGSVSSEQLKNALRPETGLVSFMHVNNETGAVTDIARMAKICKQAGVVFHVDAAQSVGKLPIDLSLVPIDLMSVSAHKIYGPKGIGALFVRRNNELQITAQIHGGGHERGMRSGTIATHQVAGFGKALELAKANMSEEQERIRKLKMQFWDGIRSLDVVELNGDIDKSVPGIINVAFNGVDGETLLMTLRELAISSGSACTSASVEPSYVLKAMGMSAQRAHDSLRFSFGRFTTSEDVKFAIEKIKSAVQALLTRTH